MQLIQGTLLQKGKYRIEKTLGQGSFGITYLATAKSISRGEIGRIDVKASVAIKEFYMRDINNRRENTTHVEGSSSSIFSNYKKRFKKEAEHLASLSHPNIVKIYDIFEENGTVYYVMEYLGETNLNNYIKINRRISEKECLRLVGKIGNALQYMHDSKMLHLDLKPDNIMLKNDEPILIDFGLSKQFSSNGQPETSTTIGLGTKGYAPLEQANYDASTTRHIPYQMDVYALGATMFKMIVGHTPPDSSAIFNYGFPTLELESTNISSFVQNAVKKAMAPDTGTRFKTIGELLSVLKIEIGDDHTIIRRAQVTGKTKEIAKDSSYQTPTLNKDYRLNAPTATYIIKQTLGVSSTHITYLAILRDKPYTKIVIKELFTRNQSERIDGLTVRYNKQADPLKDDAQEKIGEFITNLPQTKGLEHYIDYFEANGTYYYVSEYIEGENLYEILRNKTKYFTESEVIKLGKQISHALNIIHRHGYRHLDIQLNNIIKDKNGNYILTNILKCKYSGLKENDISTQSTNSKYSTPANTDNSKEAFIPYSIDISQLVIVMCKLLIGNPYYTPNNNRFEETEKHLIQANVSEELIKVIRNVFITHTSKGYVSSSGLLNRLNNLSNNKTTIVPTQKEESIFKSLLVIIWDKIWHFALKILLIFYPLSAIPLLTDSGIKSPLLYYVFAVAIVLFLICNGLYWTSSKGEICEFDSFTDIIEEHKVILIVNVFIIISMIVMSFNIYNE